GALAPHPFGEFVPEEVAAALKLAPTAATGELVLADALCRRLPATLAALEDGTIDLPRARAMVEGTGVLTDEHAGVVEGRVLARGGRSNRSGLRRAVRSAVVAVDPDAANKRAKAARSDRYIGVTPLADGVSELCAVIPAVQAQAAYLRVDQLAKE